MQDLTDVFETIDAGWSGRVAITQRAQAMLSHAEKGNVLRAEEYASEIERIMHYIHRRNGAPVGMMPDGREEWMLGHKFWAGMIICDAWMLSRRFWPSAGSDEDAALAEAQRVFGREVTARDIEPVFPASRQGAAA